MAILASLSPWNQYPCPKGLEVSNLNRQFYLSKSCNTVISLNKSRFTYFIEFLANRWYSLSHQAIQSSTNCTSYTKELLSRKLRIEGLWKVAIEMNSFTTICLKQLPCIYHSIYCTNTALEMLKVHANISCRVLVILDHCCDVGVIDHKLHLRPIRYPPTSLDDKIQQQLDQRYRAPIAFNWQSNHS